LQFAIWKNGGFVSGSALNQCGIRNPSVRLSGKKCGAPIPPAHIGMVKKGDEKILTHKRLFDSGAIWGAFSVRTFLCLLLGDGDRIVVYHPGGAKGRGVPVSNSPPPIPQGKCPSSEQ
jgi:hypothetical protein